MRHASYETVRNANRMAMCALDSCHGPFSVCVGCDRGRRYCSKECSAQARRLQQRLASRAYQASERGKLAHAARQARYRARKRQVTQQCEEVGVSAKISTSTHQAEQSGRIESTQTKPSVQAPPSDAMKAPYEAPAVREAAPADFSHCLCCSRFSPFLRRCSLRSWLERRAYWRRRRRSERGRGTAGSGTTARN